MKKIESNPSRLPLLPLAVALALLTGCGANVRGDGRIAIDSTPAGATVNANGQDIGTTPLRMKPGEYYSAGLNFGAKSGIASVSYQGTLTLSKPGCESHSTKVNDAVLSKDIHVELVCDTSAALDISEPPPAASAAGETAAQRLTQLESLRTDGLISAQEFESIRGRILTTL